MEKKQRVSKGEKYWWISSVTNLEVCCEIDFGRIMDDMRFDNGNYFLTKEAAEAMAEKLRAVLKGAEIMEDWQKEKIETWDSMLETKDIMSKAAGAYGKLIKDPKIAAIRNGAEVIKMPSEEEIDEEASQIAWNRQDEYRDENGELVMCYGECYDSAKDMAKWLESKIVRS